MNLLLFKKDQILFKFDDAINFHKIIFELILKNSLVKKNSTIFNIS